MKNSSGSASSVLAATNLPSPFSTGAHFPCLFLLKHRKFFRVVLDVSFSLSLSSRCALTFLTPSLHVWTMPLHSSFVACPCFHLLYAAFVTAQSQVHFQTVGSVSCYVYSHSRTYHSCTQRMLSFKTWQPSAADLLFKTAFLCIPPTSSLNKPKICSLEV